MKKILLIILAIYLMIGCQTREEVIPERNQKNDISIPLRLSKGDWIGQRINVIGIGDNSTMEKEHTLSNDEHVFFYDPYTTSRFEIKNDTLEMNIASNNIHWKNLDYNEYFKFKIDQVTDTSFYLIPLDTFTRYNFYSDEYYKIAEDTILFTHINKKNSISFERLGGYYSRTYIEIDNKRNLYFFSRNIDFKERGYTGKISEENYKILINKIEQIDWNIDDIGRGVYLGNIGYHSSIPPASDIIIQSTTSEEKYWINAYYPSELNLLQHYVFHIYQEMEMIKTDNIKKKFKFKKFMKERVR